VRLPLFTGLLNAIIVKEEIKMAQKKAMDW